MTDNSNIIFKAKMTEIGVMDAIEKYLGTKKIELEITQNFQNLSEEFKKQKAKRIELLYKDSCAELEQMKVLNARIEKLLSGLKVFSTQGDEVYNKALYKLSKSFKENLSQYNDSIDKFKKNFSVLKKLLDSKKTDDDYEYIPYNQHNPNFPQKPITR